MPSVFISYRRKPSAMLATLIARELQTRGITAYIDTRQLDGGGPFPDRLLGAIEDADVFICLIAEDTFQSDWVQREVDHAYRLGKLMIPVFQESYVPIHEPADPASDALLHSDGVHIMDVRNVFVDQSLDEIARMVKATAGSSLRIPWSRVAWIAAGLMIVVLAALLLITSGVLNGGDGSSGEDPNGPNGDLSGLLGALTRTPQNSMPAEATPEPDDHTLTNQDWEPELITYQDITFVNVPGGCFTMGPGDSDPEYAPAHSVCIGAEYWISKTPITQAQYRACVDDGGCSLPADTSYYDNHDYDDAPIVNVSWEQAAEYAEWLDASLPSEAMWEYAARGPDSWPYPWGDDEPTCDLAIYADCTDDLPVMDYDTASSWVGALHMAGTVWEWVEDWDGSYPDFEVYDPLGPENGTEKIIRGGAYDSSPGDLTATYRGALLPDDYGGHLGFRVVILWDLREAPEQQQ